MDVGKRHTYRGSDTPAKRFGGQTDWVEQPDAAAAGGGRQRQQAAASAAGGADLRIGVSQLVREWAAGASRAGPVQVIAAQGAAAFLRHRRAPTNTDRGKLRRDCENARSGIGKPP